MTGTLGATTYQPTAVVNDELTGLSVAANCLADPSGALLTFTGSGAVPVAFSGSLPAGTNSIGTVTANAGTGTMTVAGTVTANAGTGTFSTTGTGSAGTPAAGVFSVQGVPGGTSVPVSLASTGPATLFSESLTARTTSGNSGDLTPTGNPSAMTLSYNISAVSGVLPTLVVALQQKDANGVYQTLASTGSLAATGTGLLSTTDSVMVFGNNATRVAWTIGGTGPSYTVQFSLITR